MFKKILIATDLSESSNLIVNCVGELKTIGVEEVVLAHVVYDSAFLGSYELFIKETIDLQSDNEDYKKASPILEKQKEILEEGGLKTEIKIVRGMPAQAIDDLSEQLGVSAIFVGSHGKGIIKRAALGSVSSELIGISKKPVFLIRTKLEDTYEVALSCKRVFNHILYLTDFSDTAEKALDYLENIVQGTKCAVTAMSVQESGRYDEYTPYMQGLYPEMIEKINALQNKEVQDKLDVVRERLEKAGSSKVLVAYPEGRPIDVAIDTITKNQDMSLVVMGTQGKGFAKEFFMGSLSLQISRYSPIPVLLIPAKS